MSKVLKYNLHTLEYLTKANKNFVKAILSKADTSLIKAISEISRNVFNTEIPITPFQRRKLKPYSSFIKSLGSKSVSVSRKRKLLKSSRASIIPLMIDVVMFVIKNIL